MEQIDRIMKIQEVVKITGLPKSTIYAKMEKNEFPKPLKLSIRSVGWRQSTIKKWIDELEEAS